MKFSMKDNIFKDIVFFYNLNFFLVSSLPIHINGCSINF